MLAPSSPQNYTIVSAPAPVFVPLMYLCQICQVTFLQTDQWKHDTWHNDINALNNIVNSLQGTVLALTVRMSTVEMEIDDNFITSEVDPTAMEGA